MAVTPNYGWPIPVATDYVKDGWDAIADLGNAIDTTVATLGSGLTRINTTTVTTQSAVTISNIFSSNYQNYRVEINLSAASANSSLTMQYTTGGTASATAYYYGGVYALENSTGGYTGAANNTSALLTSFNASYATSTGISVDIFDPYNSIPTKHTVKAFGVNSSPSGQHYSAGGHHYVSTSYDGLKILPNSGTFSGTIRIYGYQNS